MRWAIVAAVILVVTAAIAVNALLLLSYGSEHTDPVGTLSPVAHVPTPPSSGPTRVTTLPHVDHGGRGHANDD